MTKKVFCTGGAGFLGRAILRHAEQLDWQITVYSRDETIQDEARRRYPQARYILGDVRDISRLALAMVGHDYVIHAAAMKYIPEAEINASECFSVNIGGAESVIAAARQAGVERAVGISTDKACQPVNSYGASKFVMERLFAEASTPNTQFNCVRYGNVVGSTGSVIPLFRWQYETHGRVTVTDPNMTRFWMGVDEAINLILTALEDKTPPGAIVIPLVKAMKMSEVVLAAVGEVPVDIIGIRPGEKMHERLLHFEESVRVVQRDDDFLLLPPGNDVGGIEPFTLTSQNPHYWMLPEEMRALVEDAEDV